MLLTAFAFRELARQTPDCGSTFTWATRAFGPWVGWLAGWAAFIAATVAVGNGAQIAAIYLLNALHLNALADSIAAQVAVGALAVVVLAFPGAPCPESRELRGRLWAVQTTGDADVQLVAEFVRRLRRVALHALALDDQGDEELALPGGLLRKLMQVPTSAVLHSDGTTTVRSPLPDEVQFESLATRIRPFTLAGDRLYWQKDLDALDRLSGLEDRAFCISSRDLREEWRRATDRTPRARAFFTSTAGGEANATRPAMSKSTTRLRPLISSRLEAMAWIS
jgi:hypothetical protein